MRFPDQALPNYRASLGEGSAEPVFATNENIQSPLGRRNFISSVALLAAIQLAGCVHAHAPAPAPPKILFVCQFGTAKSAIAREIFKKRARERGIDVAPFSRGIMVEDHISPELRQLLNADGIDPAADAPHILSRRDWDAADILVRFNPLPAEVRHADVRDWSDLPSVNDDYRGARIILDKRIDALLDEIEARRN